jgi:hypothetical protein
MAWEAYLTIFKEIGAIRWSQLFTLAILVIMSQCCSLKL